MAEVKPAEISNILREQLAGVKSEAELQEVGTSFKWEMVSPVFTVYRMFNPES